MTLKRHLASLALALAVAAALLLATARIGRSEPPENADPALAPWYRSLKQPGSGIGCCSIADCRPVDARTGPHGWQILVDGLWRDVPPGVILQGKENPTGRPVACIFYGDILCFVPGIMA